MNTKEQNQIMVGKELHLLTLCDAKSEVAKDLERQIEKVRINREELLKNGNYNEKAAFELWKIYSYLIEKLHKSFMIRQFRVENITTTVGRSVFAQRLAGVNTYTGNVTHTALGTSNAAPAVGNTTLGTETYRKALSSGTFLNNVSYLETFFTAAEVNGTFEEYGNFIDGTGAANSGQLFNRFIQTVAKSNVETLNVQTTITWSDG